MGVKGPGKWGGKGQDLKYEKKKKWLEVKKKEEGGAVKNPLKWYWG